MTGSADFPYLRMSVVLPLFLSLAWAVRQTSESMRLPATEASVTVTPVKSPNPPLTEEQKNLLRASFRIGPLPPTPKLGNPPDIGPIPPLVRLPDGQLDLRQRLQFVVEHNPIPWVVALHKAIVDGTVGINTQPSVDTYASFVLLPMSMVVSTERLNEQRAAVPILQFNPTRLSEMNTKAKVLEAMLAVYHESVHYKQYLKTEKENRAARFGPPKPGIKRTPEECTWRWNDEYQAYGLECTAALSWGMTDTTGELCLRAESPQDFRTYLFWLMKDSKYGQQEPECLSTWAELAHHPHPEAYE